MNRIILIGNGFDLAHGIPTSYKDFINDFWENKIKEIKKTELNNIYEDSDLCISGEVPETWLPGYLYEDMIESLRQYNCTLTYKNGFLDIITSKLSAQNWVDIENEYYSLLKKAYKKNSNYDISNLNSDLNRIQENLKEYLDKVIKTYHDDIDRYREKNADVRQIIGEIGGKIYSPFNLKDFTEDSINKKAEIEYNKVKKDIEAIKDGHISLNDLNTDNRRLISYLPNESNEFQQIRELLISNGAINFFDLHPDQVLFLNFNYTHTEKAYLNSKQFDRYHCGKNIEVKSIHIHGSLNPVDKNPIIFGFGDEIDEDYKTIENLDDNRYLENIKSIKYLETDNYKNLLEFLNSNDYQVFIFGHSCGISDRTLLNTIFEHKNCVSIKPFYHRINENKDNFSDIVRNISRNFNNKAVMRDKVVNKKYCEPLLLCLQGRNT